MRTTPIDVPDWTAVIAAKATEGVPVRIRASADPAIFVYAEETGSYIGLEVALGDRRKTVSTSLTEMEIDEVAWATGRFVRVRCRNRELFPEFLKFAALVVELASRGIDPNAAVEDAVVRMKKLLHVAPTLSREEKIGLFGELWTLRRLIASRGTDAAKAWIGPVSDQHDFRFEKIEIESKTTASPLRKHTISSLGQMIPSVDRKLFLLSLKVALAGEAEGLSIAGLASDIAARLVGDRAAARAFDAMLATARYSAEFRSVFEDTWILREPARLIPVVPGTPHLTNDALALLPPGYAVGRMSDFKYKIDVEGLGWPDGSREFESAIASGD